MGLNQSLRLKIRILWHAIRRRHRLETGISNGVKILYCKCGYFKPRVNFRYGEKSETRKFLTSTEVRRLVPRREDSPDVRN